LFSRFFTAEIIV